MRSRLLIVRHPQTEANVNGRFVGRGDTPYTELGELQRELLAAEIASFGPDRIVASPVRRTREVAESAADVLGLEPAYDELITELDFGAAEGLTYAELCERGIQFDFKREDAPVAPGGESRLEIFRRSAAVADREVRAGGRVAIVTHGGVFRSMVVYLLGLPLSAIWSFDIQPAQLAEVLVGEDHALLVAFRRPEGERVD
jgi:broad specificity phosphatase PhoE